MPLSALSLDHLVVTTRFELARAAALFRRLGFSLSPLGRHGLGSINHVAVFEGSYLELIGVPTDGGLQRQEVLEAPVGIDALVYGATDADALHLALAGLGLPVQAVQDLSRPVERDGVSVQAAFRAVRSLPGTFAAGRVYYCQHLTPELVWQPGSTAGHANGVVSITRLTVVATDPAAEAARFAPWTGVDPMPAGDGSLRLISGDFSLEFLSRAAYAQRFGASGCDDLGRTSFFGAIHLATRDPAAVAALAAAAGDEVLAAPAAGGLAVRLRDFNCLLVFEAAAPADAGRQP